MQNALAKLWSMREASENRLIHTMEEADSLKVKLVSELEAVKEKIFS